MLPSNAQVVFPKLTDPNFFCKYVPDLVGSSVQDDTHFIVKMKVGVGFIHQTLTFNFHFDEKKPPEFAKVAGKGTAPGSVVDLWITFTLNDIEGGVRVAWNAEIKLSGTIAALAGGALEPVINTNVKRFLDSLTSGIKSEVGA